jgi:carbon storage regulator
VLHWGTLADVLVLSRRPGESIVIGNDVIVTIVGFRGDQVRLGIDAPRSVQIYRRELYDEISRANQMAASVQPRDLDGLPGPLGA